MDLFNLVFGISSPNKVENQVAPSNDRSRLVSAAIKEDRNRSLIVPNSCDFENELFDLVNEHRKSLRLQTVTRTTELNAIASEHTQFMREVNIASHDNWNEKRAPQLLDLGFPNRGENVAGGECYPWEVEKMMNWIVPGWIDSPGHKEVMETPRFTHSGFALSISQHRDLPPDRIVFFATQVFTARA
jgi:uncharacterized protein YkwD